jgi:5-amino-6-(5-phosphoribosylamino)uracil reductase
MRQLLPSPSDRVDPYDTYRPEDPHAPLVRLNMVASADGAVTDRRGRSGGLGGDGDRVVFRALRALADAVLVGAGTVRAERCGPHRPPEALAARRRADGRTRPAGVVVVSRSLDLDTGAPLFAEAEVPTVVLTCAASDPGRRAAIERVGRVVVAGDTWVDLAAGLVELRERLGWAHVLCEGGPTLNAQLLAADLVDELCLTVAPQLVGGSGPRLAAEIEPPRQLDLAAVCEQDGELLLRYRLDPLRALLELPDLD